MKVIRYSRTFYDGNVLHSVHYTMSSREVELDAQKARRVCIKIILAPTKYDRNSTTWKEALGAKIAMVGKLAIKTIQVQNWNTYYREGRMTQRMKWGTHEPWALEDWSWVAYQGTKVGMNKYLLSASKLHWEKREFPPHLCTEYVIPVQ